MKIAFPHMGRIYIPLKTLFQSMGIEVVLPDPNNSCTKALGYKFAPEHACMPFKLILGNILSSLEKGADTVIMLGGSGPCRFGYFGNMLALVSRDIGYQFQCIILEPKNLLPNLYYFKRLAGCSYWSIFSSILLGWRKLFMIDQLERLYWKVIPYTTYRAKADRLFSEGMQHIEEIHDTNHLEKVFIGHYNSLRDLQNARTPRPRVGIVGDIYTLNEPYSNHNLEKMLVELGVEVERSVYPSDWVARNLFPWKRSKVYSQMLEYTKGYLNSSVGGFALETVYNSLKYAEKGFRGIIHIMPMTCMPEIVSRQILQKISRDKNISILSITVDEHEGATGFKTRIEAFAEMLHQKK